MELICSAGGIVDTLHPGQGAGDLAKAGFDGALFNLPSELDEDEYKAFKRQAKNNAAGFVGDGKEVEPEAMTVVADRIFGAIAKKGLRLRVARLRMLPFKAAVYGLKRAEAAGTKAVIVDLNPRGQRKQYGWQDEAAQWAETKEVLLELAGQSADGTMLLLVNNGKWVAGGRLQRAVFSDAPVAAARIDELNIAFGREKFGFVLDVAVASLLGQDMQSFAVTLGRRLKAVIASECDGHFLSYLLPFTSSYGGRSAVDWLGLLRGLRQIAFDGFLIMVFHDTAAAFSPLLRPALLTLAKSIGNFLAWQVGIEQMIEKTKSIVLFGAGNMSRNFMKCYGEKHRPLYVTDNDRKRWGEEFCGLEIRPPEALKKLPDDCTVVICNIYYREIEEQLAEMGIKNIAFFNDEYLPTFYFDRLKSKGI